MTATKQGSNQKVDVLYWIVAIGTVLFYIASSISIIIVGINQSALDDNKDNADLFKIIWDSLGNAGTLIPLVLSIISGIYLKSRNEHLSTLNTVFISTTGFFLYCFYNVSVNHYIHPVVVAVVGLITFVVSISIILFTPITVVIQKESIISAAIGKKIRNDKIASIQLFDCYMTEERDCVNYSIHSIEHLSNDDSDINGMLAVTYKLKKADVNGFDFVTKTNYQALIESANDNVKDELLKLIKDKSDDIKKRLQNIPDATGVTKDDCCLARLMVMYNAYQKILTGGMSSVPDAYIGEQDFRDGDLGVSVDVEKRLFTLIRTGLLGGVLVGPNCIYSFQYRKDGYKVGRQYCVFHINQRECVNRNHIYLCLVVLKEGSMKAIPPYVLQAIRKLIPVLEEALHKSVQGGE